MKKRVRLDLVVIVRDADIEIKEEESCLDEQEIKVFYIFS